MSKFEFDDYEGVIYSQLAKNFNWVEIDDELATFDEKEVNEFLNFKVLRTVHGYCQVSQNFENL